MGIQQKEFWRWRRDRDRMRLLKGKREQWVKNKQENWREREVLKKKAKEEEE